ncbi:Prolyl tripeptidyl peptidase precursor [Botrimarina colliarenosi]|uniref:Prolyl tripeptidyl peptidase n=1 Tax=Botrimarina colliarenosi TaxID=2528001 RepID=A0A5C6AN93_9BACT|nr:S9 family peptidase [Botrimarina colliarenosi]TWT99633.1 Prolyl tripeptidyl peptidase precursor [Botrimarina colliarenosi]
MRTLTELAFFVALLAIFASGCDSLGVGVYDPEISSTPPSAKATQKAPTQNQVAAVRETKNDAAASPLIPRDVLFGNPDRAQARLSPDGKFLSYLKPVDGVLNVWVGPADDVDAAKPVTDDKLRGIRSHGWAYNSQYIVYTQDKGGDENWHVYATNVETKATRDLTPIDGVRGELAGASERFPDELLVGFNDRDPRFHDLYRVNLLTGEKTLVQENPGFAGFVTDDDFKVRLAVNFTPAAGQVWLKPKTDEPGEKGYAEGDWEPMEEFSSVDAMTSGPSGFDKAGAVLFFEDSRDRNTAGLFSRNLETGDTKLVADDPRVDVGGVMSHPTEKTLQAVSFTYSKTEWKILDEAIRADIEFLQQFPKESGSDGEFVVSGRTLDDSKWTVAYLLDDGPMKFYIYDRKAEDGEKMRFLFNSRDDLSGYKLAKMHTPVIESRDGMKLVSYLTLPVGSDPDGDGVPAKPLPMVLDVHGGPWSRDGWGFNASHQWLANRGYAVLSVNYRGSTGFGKAFLNAANGQWAGKMHDDLLDAVQWAEDRGVADQDKVCIMGGSYGGYATLVGLTFTPDVFACGVDIVGPSSLVTLMNNVPPYWYQFMPVMKERVGDWETEEGKAGLLAKSPLSKVDQIERPLLIGQGANDPRVTQLEADQIVEAMQEKEIPVTYALFPDEGHGFARPENRMSFNAVTEMFLAKNLGGRYEPLAAEDLKGSSLHVPAGASDVPGLAEVLPAERKEMPKVEPEPAADAS